MSNRNIQNLINILCIPLKMSENTTKDEFRFRLLWFARTVVDFSFQYNIEDQKNYFCNKEGCDTICIDDIFTNTSAFNNVFKEDFDFKKNIKILDSLKSTIKTIIRENYSTILKYGAKKTKFKKNKNILFYIKRNIYIIMIDALYLNRNNIEKTYKTSILTQLYDLAIEKGFIKKFNFNGSDSIEDFINSLQSSIIK